MSKKINSVHFEWSIAEDGAFWPDAELLAPVPVLGFPSARLQPGSYPRSKLLGQTLPLFQANSLFQVIVLVLTGLLTTASTPLFPLLDEPARLQRQIEATLQDEERVWRQNDIARFRHLMDPQVYPEWRSDWSTPWGIPPDQRTTLGTYITGIEAQGDLLWVHTRVTQSLIAWWYAPPFRELRFYRRSPNGWVRTSPSPADWGQMREVATPHLRFQFYERDTPTILAMSVRVELAYLQLYHLLGRSPPPTPLTLTFTVMPDQMREFRMNEEPLRFASPSLLKASTTLSEVEYATHLVISHLADRVLLEILGPTGRQQVIRWRTMFWAASGCLRIEVLGERSPWQQEAEAFFRQTDWSQRPLRFTDIDDRYTGLTVPREAYLWEYMAAESLISYLVQRYGWEGVIALFGGFGQSIYWSKVIPSAFDQSAVDLEIGWNRYLAKTYAQPHLAHSN